MEKISLELVDGSKCSLAEMIVKNKVTGESVLVATFGIGIKQIKMLLWEFDKVTIVIDSSHSSWQKKLWDRILYMNDTNEKLTIKVAQIHAKLAIIDGEVAVITSANLSQNQFIESYVIGNVSEIKGSKKVIDFLNSIPDNSVDWDRNKLNESKNELNESKNEWEWL